MISVQLVYNGSSLLNHEISWVEGDFLRAILYIKADSHLLHPTAILCEGEVYNLLFHILTMPLKKFCLLFKMRIDDMN